jgi:putative ABC transport system permease protein
MSVNFRIAIRHLWQNKLFSFINIIGLSLGLVSCTVILLHVRFELSYDRFHLKSERIARVLTNNVAFTPYVLASSLNEYFPEIERITRIAKFNEGGFFVNQHERIIAEKDLVYADSCFFHVFSFPLKYGDPDNTLRSPDKLMISEKSAFKYFERENPVGKQISLRIDNTNYDFTIEGVFKDFPAQSHFQANFLLSMEFFTRIRKGSSLSNWGNCSVATYVLMQKQGMIQRINERMPGLIKKYVPKELAPDTKFTLQGLEDIHLYSKALEFDIEPQGNITRVIIFASVAVLVLVIALVNFILLSMALSFQRLKEFGIRKVIGAQRKDLISLVTFEFLIIFVLALQIAFMLLEFAAPLVENQMNLSLSHGFIVNLGVMLSFLIVVILLGYLASIYIAVHISKLSPVDAIKSRIALNNLRLPSRGVLLVFQFSIMICLLSCLVGMQKQLYLLHNKDLGFRKEQLMIIDIPGGSYSGYIRMKEELSKLPSIARISGAAYIPPSDEFWICDVKNPTSGESIQIEEINADYGFIEAMEIKMIQGRSFSRDFSSDSMAVLINETGLKRLGIKDPLDSYLIGPEYYPNRKRLMIIGVFRDFHIRSMYEKIYPMAVFLSPEMTRKMAIRLKPESLDKSMELIQGKWKSVFPDDPMQYSFVEDGMRLKYIREDQTHALIGMFTFLSIVIALMGLFGLSTFAAQRRTKEIGIRKVSGADTLDIFYILCRQFGRWIALSFLMGVPVAWFIMHRWLQHFAYRTEISWWIFVLAVVFSLLVAGITISWQTLKAATRNPVEALRYE